LLKIQAEDLTALELGDSDRLQVGDHVMAIGNPFGLGRTVASGIVSALGRSGLNIEGYEDFIQNDAPINPGIRGGQTLTLTARLKEGAPLESTDGERGHGRLSGAELRDLQPDDPHYGEVSGVVVTQVEIDNRAARSGLEVGDIILAANQVPVTSVVELRQQLDSIDDAPALTIQRGLARIFLLIR